MRLFRNVGIIRLHRREYLSHTGQFNRRRSAVSALTPASPPSLNPRFSGWAKRIMRRVAWPIACPLILNLLTASRSYVRRLLSPRMKTTRYFREQVLRKRPYIRLEWCERILAQPLAKMVQSDGRPTRCASPESSRDGRSARVGREGSARRHPRGRRNPPQCVPGSRL